MIYPDFFAPRRARVPLKQRKLFVVLCSMLTLAVCAPRVGGLAQGGFEREVNAPEKVEITIKNASGRVTVIATDEQQKKVSIKAESAGGAVAEENVISKVVEGRMVIEVRPRGTTANANSGANVARRRSDEADPNRIDITVRVPVRSKMRVETEGGAVDIVGNVAFAEARTDTGTIRADVPLDALKYSFQWTTSRPRIYSEVELPKIKEKRGGIYEISGRFGDKKAKEDERIRLELTTERGVVLFGVADASTVPTDLRERALTESARAIIRSGHADLIGDIRKLVPHLVGDYAETLPALKNAPSFTGHTTVPAGATVTAASNLVRLNASVTDQHGRAIRGLTEKDFAVFENGEPRSVKEVASVNAPFNIVLLLDVSGSVEERLDFIRKAALAFLNTVGAQDRISIISFRDDVQVVSDFTSDRRLLAERIKSIEAGGGTALYDSLAYALVQSLKPLRGDRTAIVVLSDGDDNKSFVSFPTLLEATIESGALIYPLYIPSGLIPSGSAPAPVVTLDPMRSRFLALTSRAEQEGKRLAEESGGVYHSIKRLDDLQRAYDDVVAQLRTAYTITYDSNANGAARRASRVRVRVARDGAMVRLSPSVAGTSVAP